MASNTMNRPEGCAEPTVVPQPKPPSAPVPDNIEPVASGSGTNNISSSNDSSRSEARDGHQPLRFVESSASSSGDEIAPCGEQSTATPFKKSRHGKFAYSDRYDASEYVIEQLSEYDDIDLVKPWHRTLILIHPVVIVWVFLTYAAYYGYRVWCNYQFRLVYGGLAEASWIFIVVEGVILCTCSLDNITHCWHADNAKCRIFLGWLFCYFRSVIASAQSSVYAEKQYQRWTYSSQPVVRSFL